MKADLHCHTVLSDGAMRVDQIIFYVIIRLTLTGFSIL